MQITQNWPQKIRKSIVQVKKSNFHVISTNVPRMDWKLSSTLKSNIFAFEGPHHWGKATFKNCTSCTDIPRTQLYEALVCISGWVSQLTTVLPSITYLFLFIILENLMMLKSVLDWFEMKWKFDFWPKNPFSKFSRSFLTHLQLVQFFKVALPQWCVLQKRKYCFLMCLTSRNPF